MTILVTGAAGFVGRALMRHLAATGRPHLGVDRDAGPGGRRLDVTDAAMCRVLLAEVRPRAIIHAAAITPADAAPATIAHTIAVNVAGSANILAAALASGVARVVVASSSGVYGAAAGGPIAEDDPLDLANAYAASKRAAELAAAAAPQGFAVAARIGPVYGPDETPRPTRPRVSAIGQLMRALANGGAVTVNGATISRDWTPADDIARGLVALADLEAPRHAVYNLSAGVPVAFADVVAAFAAHGLAANWVDDPAAADIALRPNDARRPLAIDRLVAETGFTPTPDFATGLARILAARPPGKPAP